MAIQLTDNTAPEDRQQPRHRSLRTGRERTRAGVAGLVLFLGLTMKGCVSVPVAPPSNGGGTVQADEAPPGAPIELTVRTPDGRWIYIGDLRGRPVLLVFLATYDGVSQAALVPLRRVYLEREDIHMVGVLVQHEADTMADAWVAALNPPFPVGFDPEDTLLEGDSPLGVIDAVPTFVTLDARGVVVERRVGYQSERALNDMLDTARRHAPVRERAPPPLLGTPSVRRL